MPLAEFTLLQNIHLEAAIGNVEADVVYTLTSRVAWDDRRSFVHTSFDSVIDSRLGCGQGHKPRCGKLKPGMRCALHPWSDLLYFRKQLKLVKSQL